MPKLSIDGREVTVPEGSTVLQACKALGIDVPSLCHCEGLEPSTSCMTCLVRVDGAGTLRPSCATPATEGMAVASEVDDVRAARAASLELLMSDHAGDCTAPCQLADPLHIEFPRFVRQVQQGDLDGAAGTLAAYGVTVDNLDARRAMKACRRGRADQGLALDQLVRYVAEQRGGLEVERPADVPPYRDYSVRLGKMSPEEMAEVLASAAADAEQAEGGEEACGEGGCGQGECGEGGCGEPGCGERGCRSAGQASGEAYRCLHCDCRLLHTCTLRKACEAYGVDTSPFRVGRPPVVVDRTHSDIVWEPGKCIRCGLCLQVAGEEGEQLGFTFVERGFCMHLQLPGGEAKGLGALALPCAKVCPTGALAPR